MGGIFGFLWQAIKASHENTNFARPASNFPGPRNPKQGNSGEKYETAIKSKNGPGKEANEVCERDFGWVKHSHFFLFMTSPISDFLFLVLPSLFIWRLQRRRRPNPEEPVIDAAEFRGRRHRPQPRFSFSRRRRSLDIFYIPTIPPPQIV